MQDILLSLTPADYQFLVGLIESPLNLTDDQKLNLLLNDVLEEDTPGAREALCKAIEAEVRYLGSSDVAYFFRYTTGQEPGVSFGEIIRDSARTLRVRLTSGLSERAQLRELVHRYVSDELARMPREQQQEMLESLGVEREKAVAFIAKSAGAFAIPMLIQTFGILVVDGIIKRVIFGAITRLIGRRISAQLFEIVIARFPWWVRWIAPATWGLSFGWMALDVMGPAMRKTIPFTLYLGLCILRDEQGQ